MVESPETSRDRTNAKFFCGRCRKVYSKKEHLQRHERVHDGQRPYSCQTCGRRFARQDALARHMAVHTSASTPGVQGANDMPIASFVDLQAQDDPSSTSTLGTSAEEQLSIDYGSAATDGGESFSPLFWPDTESFLQSIMSLDSMSSEQLITTMTAMPDPNFDSEQNSRTDISEHHDRVADGYRAIHTLNGLISNTFHSVTASAALDGLSSTFLDSCLHMFLYKFLKILPIVHIPTFAFRECSAPFLMIAIALGSLFLGTQDAVEKGEALWRLAHVAIATSWHAMVGPTTGHDTSKAVQLVQTALLCQTYAAMSKDRTIRKTSQVFHGLGFYWARNCGMFDFRPFPDLPSPNDPMDVKSRSWKRWAASETQLRTLLGLYVLDGVISQYSGNPTAASHMSNMLALPCHEDTFDAPDQDTWLRLHARSQIPMHRFCDLFRILFYSKDNFEQLDYGISDFSIKVVLEGISSLVMEINRIDPPPVGLPSRSHICGVLYHLRQYLTSTQNLSDIERHAALVRWHAICLDLESSTARGARRMCYRFGIAQHIFGGECRDEHNVDPLRFIQSMPGRKALLHAVAIQDTVARLPLGSVHDVHMPGAVFAAATTCAAFALAGALKLPLPSSVDWKTVVCADSAGQNQATDVGDEAFTRNSDLFVSGNFNVASAGAILHHLTYDLSSIRILLQGLALRWGVAREMEEVVGLWIVRCT